MWQRFRNGGGFDSASSPTASEAMQAEASHATAASSSATTISSSTARNSPPPCGTRKTNSLGQFIRGMKENQDAAAKRTDDVLKGLQKQQRKTDKRNRQVLKGLILEKKRQNQLKEIALKIKAQQLNLGDDVINGALMLAAENLMNRDCSDDSSEESN